MGFPCFLTLSPRMYCGIRSKSSSKPSTSEIDRSSSPLATASHTASRAVRFISPRRLYLWSISCGRGVWTLGSFSPDLIPSSARNTLVACLHFLPQSGVGSGTTIEPNVQGRWINNQFPKAQFMWTPCPSLSWKDPSVTNSPHDAIASLGFLKTLAKSQNNSRSRDTIERSNFCNFRSLSFWKKPTPPSSLLATAAFGFRP